MVILGIIGDMHCPNYRLWIMWLILVVHGLCVILVVIVTYYTIKVIRGNRAHRL